MKLSKSWQSAGIPAGYDWPKLIFNAASETLVVELRAIRSDYSPSRLFARHKDAISYEPIGTPAEDISYESAVTCEARPLVVFNSTRSSRHHSGRDWVSLCVFNLQTHELSPLVWSGRLTLPEPYNDLQISKLIRLSDSGDSLCLTVGLRWLNQMRVDSYLAQLDLAEMNLQLVSRLSDTLF